MKKKLLKINNILNKLVDYKPKGIVVFTALFIFALFSTFIFFNIDNDFWFLINTGKYIINNGFPVTEPFTLHTDFVFVVQQWLTDVIFYFIYNKFDVYGMLVLLTIINFIIIMLIYHICKLVTENKVKLSFVITILVSTLLNIYFINTRPQLFDIVLLLLEIYLLELYIKSNKKLYLIGLPIISLLMINLHASMWFMLFIFLVPYYIDNIVKIKHFEKDKYSIIPLIIVTIIMLLLGFINPYGIDSIIYLFGSYGVESINNQINEMMPVTINKFNGILVFIYIFVILYSCYHAKEKKLKLRYLLLFFGTCYLGLSHNKGMLFLFIGGFPLLMHNLKTFIPEKEETNFLCDYKVNNIILGTTVILAVILYSSLCFSMDLKTKNRNSLEGIINYLDVYSEEGATVYTNYNDGGYVEYRGYKCYMDPRAEVFLKSKNKKEDVFEEYVDLQKGLINYKEFLNKYKFDYLLVNSNDLLYHHVEEEDGYTAIYDTYSTDENGERFGYKIFKRLDNEEVN